MDVSKFNVGSVTDMQFMFYKNHNLAAIDLTSWVNSTPQLTAMNSMFQDCTSLTQIDLSKFFYNIADEVQASNLTTMAYLFSGCTNLQKVDLSSLRSAEKLTSMGFLFNDCRSLTDVVWPEVRMSTCLQQNMPRYYGNTWSICNSIKPETGNSSTVFGDMQSMFQNCRLHTDMDPFRIP